ncbi:MAG: hypothetical protein V1492_03335 [Candidatus Micrarchaeota archaeon]
MTFIPRKWSLTLKVIPIVLAVVLLKLVFHYYGWEIISLNLLFSGLIAAVVFLIGFLISGVLVDYKEGEKLPGEMAASLEAINDEVSIIYKNKKAKEAKECLGYIITFNQSVLDWFRKKEKTRNIVAKITGFNDYFIAFEPLTQANFIVRMKQEQSNLRRIVTRVHTIRETSFVSSGYAIAEITTALLVIGLLLARIDPFHESLFFVGIITFLLVYMLLLISDLDNPFQYYGNDGGEEVSLKPLDDLLLRLQGAK